MRLCADQGHVARYNRTTNLKSTSMRTLLLTGLAACYSFLIGAAHGDPKESQPDRPLKVLDYNTEDLIDIKNADENELMLLHKLKSSDNIVLVCYFEEVYTPIPRKTCRGEEFVGHFFQDKHGRVVQVLKGQIRVGEPFIMRKYAENPDPATYPNDKVITIPSRGKMSYVVFHTKDSRRENGAILHLDLDLDSEYRCHPDFPVRLSRFLKVKPATIEQQAF